MPTFTLTNKAIADLKDIGRYTLEHWGREQRNLYLGMLDASFQQVRIAATFGMAT
jgi:toxin ParE1/3/4